MNAPIPSIVFTTSDNPEALYPMEMLVLSHSSRTSFRDCARLLEFRQFYGESPYNKEDNFTGDVGKALHHGFAVWLTTYDENRAMYEMLLKFPYEEEYLKSSNEKRSMEACVATMDALMKSSLLHPYEIAQIKLDDGTVRNCTEVPFALQVIGSPMAILVWFVGVIDCILYNRQADRYIVVDLKTTRMNMLSGQAKFEYDEQVIPYGIVLEHALGRPIEELDVSYLSVYIDIKEPIVQLFPVKKTERDIHDWLWQLGDDIERIHKYSSQKKFPRATSGNACVNWNKQCNFFDECSIRDVAQLNRIFQGKIRTRLFREDGMEPWVKAEIPYMKNAS